MVVLFIDVVVMSLYYIWRDGIRERCVISCFRVFGMLSVDRVVLLILRELVGV